MPSVHRDGRNVEPFDAGGLRETIIQRVERTRGRRPAPHQRGAQLECVGRAECVNAQKPSGVPPDVLDRLDLEPPGSR